MLYEKVNKLWVILLFYNNDVMPLISLELEQGFCLVYNSQKLLASIRSTPSLPYEDNALETLPIYVITGNIFGVMSLQCGSPSGVGMKQNQKQLSGTHKFVSVLEEVS